MYIIASYDIESKRNKKFLKLFRKYLFHQLESFFAGELTKKEYQALKSELDSIIVSDDSVQLYILPNEKALKKVLFGISKFSNSNIILSDIKKKNR
jgi:CRISPR-associated protein Cas2